MATSAATSDMDAWRDINDVELPLSTPKCTGACIISMSQSQN